VRLIAVTADSGTAAGSEVLVGDISSGVWVSVLVVMVVGVSVTSPAASEAVSGGGKVGGRVGTAVEGEASVVIVITAGNVGGAGVVSPWQAAR
jgi:hypothetical protein